MEIAHVERGHDGLTAVGTQLGVGSKPPRLRSASPSSYTADIQFDESGFVLRYPGIATRAEIQRLLTAR
jgi:hypothetical protein